MVEGVGVCVKRINGGKTDTPPSPKQEAKTSNYQERVKNSPFCWANKPHEGSIAGNKTRKVG